MATIFKDNEAHFQCLMETIQEGIIFFDKTGKISFINSTLEKITGLKCSQIAGNHCNDLPLHFIVPDSQVVPEDKDSIFDLIIKTGKSITGKDCIWKISDDRKIMFSVNAAPCLDEKGNIDGVVVAMTDVTLLKQAEIGVNDIEEVYERLTNYAGEALLRVRFSDARTIYINEAAKKILGYSLEDYLNEDKFYEKYILPEYYPRFLKEVEEMRGGKDLVKKLVLAITAKDGRTVMMEFTVIAVRDQKGKIVYIESLGRDITAREYMEKEMAKAQKLESIGLLAGGIAHDFNNILTAILGSISLAKLEARSPDMLQERLTRAEEHCLKAKALTNRLLTYSRGGSPVRKTSSLSKVLQEAAVFAVSGKNCKCKFDFADGFWSAQIDEGQMHHVAHYLVTNAAEAMPNGGTIEVGARNVRLNADQIQPLPAGNYVKWYVRDHGVGIPKEHMRKLFDPYFTTKQVGHVKGLGLGLAICYSIVKNHDGLITVDSEFAAGTVFTVYIPAVNEETDERNMSGHSEIKTSAEHKILLVDDEQFLLDVTSSMLIHLGYEVITAQCHKDALEIYGKAKEAGQPFSLIIIDLTMRGDEGGETAIRRWLTIHPEVKAIISSGYGRDPVIEEYWKYGFTGAIAKPYTLAELEKALAKIMARHDK
jgi:two-component system cell cycle sensor histidine kinase/response regulator CckA